MIEILKNWRNLPADMQGLLALWLGCIAAIPFVAAYTISAFVEYRHVQATAQQAIAEANRAQREAEAALNRINEVMK